MCNLPSRKPFPEPALVVYGDIRTITQTVGLSGMSDGNMAGLTKTS